jgi:Putative restriction endonuclease
MTTGIEPLITVADLDNYPDDGNRYELLGGKVFVSGAPDISHQLILQNVLLEILFYLKKNPVGRTVSGVGTILSNYDLVIPDIVFVRTERWRLPPANG